MRICAVVTFTFWRSSQRNYDLALITAKNSGKTTKWTRNTQTYKSIKTINLTNKIISEGDFAAKKPTNIDSIGTKYRRFCTYVFGNFITSSVWVSDTGQIDQHGSAAAGTTVRNTNGDVLHNRPEIAAIAHITRLDVAVNCFPKLSSLATQSTDAQKFVSSVDHSSVLLPRKQKCCYQLHESSFSGI